MTKKIIGIVLIVLAFITTAYFLYNNNSSINVGNTVNSIGDYKESTKSKYFNMETQILLNSVKNKDSVNGLVSLRYQIKISLKTKGVYKNLRAIATLDKSVNSKAAIPLGTPFGLTEDMTATIDGEKSKGVIIGTTSWINKNDMTSIIPYLKKPIKLDITWDNGSEKLLIQSNSLSIEKK